MCYILIHQTLAIIESCAFISSPKPENPPYCFTPGFHHGLLMLFLLIIPTRHNRTKCTRACNIVFFCTVNCLPSIVRIFHCNYTGSIIGLSSVPGIGNVHDGVAIPPCITTIIVPVSYTYVYFVFIYMVLTCKQNIQINQISRYLV